MSMHVQSLADIPRQSMFMAIILRVNLGICTSFDDNVFRRFINRNNCEISRVVETHWAVSVGITYPETTGGYSTPVRQTA